MEAAPGVGLRLRRFQRGARSDGARRCCGAALAFLASCLAASADGGGLQLARADPFAQPHVARAGRRHLWQADPLRGWRAVPLQRWPCAHARALYLRGGRDTEVRMEVDSEPATTGIAAEQTEGSGGAAAKADAPASGAVNVTIRWKLLSFPLEIDTWQSADVLKHQLFSITQVLPEDQFLIGVYQPAKDANLRELDLKNSQTLILLGEPARPPPRGAQAKNEPDAGPAHAAERGPMEASAPEGGGKGGGECMMEMDDDGASVAPDSASSPTPAHYFERLPKRGFFSFTNRIADDNGQYLRQLQDNVTGLQNPLAEVTERLRNTNLFPEYVKTIAFHEANEAAAPVNDTKDVNEDDAPTTFPREFWGKKIVDYTDEERARLKEWLNETRHWRVSTKKITEQEKIDVDQQERRSPLSLYQIFFNPCKVPFDT
jgi:hypothetical protein